MAFLMREVQNQNTLSSRLTKLGGLPITNSGTEWKRCSSCNNWMHFIGQIDLEETKIPVVEERHQILLFFICTNYPLYAGSCNEWDPDFGGNAAILVPKTNLLELNAPCNDEEFLLDETSVLLEGCDDSSEYYCNAYNKSDDLCGKIGGEPCWIQYDTTPVCSCGARMTFIAQIEHTGDFEFYECGYVFVCPVCQDQAKFLYQTD
ncbi:hypothetical protein ON05_023000 [Acaryochloris sp. CCMEE 5410]|nr:hypothetical protein ON05_023000 [Acaryochloris sp. CCMEE 5410]